MSEPKPPYQIHTIPASGDGLDAPDPPPWTTAPSQCPGKSLEDLNAEIEVPHAVPRGEVPHAVPRGEVPHAVPRGKAKFNHPQRTFTKLAVGPGKKRRTYAATFLQAGSVRTRDHSQSNWLIPSDTVQAAAAAELFNNRAVFVDHPEDNLFSPGYPSMRDLVGVTQNAHYNQETESIDGDILMYEHVAADWLIQLMDQIVADQANDLATPDVGISIVFFGTHEWDDDLTPPSKVTKSIDYVESCDIVFGPAAAGRIHHILSRAKSAGHSMAGPATGAGGNPMPVEDPVRDPARGARGNDKVPSRELTTQPAALAPSTEIPHAVPRGQDPPNGEQTAATSTPDSPALRSRGDPTASESHTTASESHMNGVFKREQDKREESIDAGSSKSSQPPLDKIEWEMVKNDLRLQMTAAVFDTWIKPTTATRAGNTIVIQAHNRFAYEWLSMRLRPTIAKTVKDTCGPKIDIEFEIPEGYTR